MPLESLGIHVHHHLRAIFRESNRERYYETHVAAKDKTVPAKEPRKPSRKLLRIRTKSLPGFRRRSGGKSKFFFGCLQWFDPCCSKQYGKSWQSNGVLGKSDVPLRALAQSVRKPFTTDYFGNSPYASSSCPDQDGSGCELAREALGSLDSTFT